MFYYNEINDFCARWLEHLVAASELPDGVVNSKDILWSNYVRLDSFSQCHFFAGIGGWPLALKIANWPESEIVWTGSCPCQPFSQSSQTRKRTGDERHLWPDFKQLIAKYRPTTIFGEQVAGPDGRRWLAEVRADLESLDYAFAAADLCAAGIGAIHARQRLFWVADANRARLEGFEQRRRRLRSAAETASTERNYAGLRERVAFEPNAALIPVYDGVSRPMDIVRAFGNALVVPLAVEFVLAFMEGQ